MEQLLDKIAKAPSAAKYGGLAGLVVLLSVLNFFFVIQPLQDQIADQENQQRGLDRQLAEKQEIAQNLNERRREMDILEQKLAEALTELPEKKDIDELLGQLNDIGKKSGLEIARVEPGVESSATFFAKIPIKMAVSGNYHEIAMFMQEIANMRRIVNVNNIKLGTPIQKNDKVVLSSEFLATTFRFVNQAAQPVKKASGE
ncbi:MAG TPA: type 4a pilus biogenesis protein PilO [Myxococcaceae bacterium]|nr:type 4a pilus biogenesis protein PilO [Myxococcaceae bacterium]